MDERMRELCDCVRQTSFDIHVYLKSGHLEKVYENTLAHRLRKKGIPVIQQHPLPVYDEDGTLVGDFYADLFVDSQLIVELKAAKTLSENHTAQLLGYLRASRIEHGILVNFGATMLQVKKLILNNR
jgi:GxxExxY protein